MLAHHTLFIILPMTYDDETVCLEKSEAAVLHNQCIRIDCNTQRYRSESTRKCDPPINGAYSQPPVFDPDMTSL